MKTKTEIKCEIETCLNNKDGFCSAENITIKKEWDSDENFGRGGWIISCDGETYYKA